jgi:Zn-dependent protease with chaperone function
MMGISPLADAGLLTAYAAAAGWRGPTALRRPWAARSPRLAIGLWLAAAASWVIAAPLAIVAVSVPQALTWAGSRSGGPAAESSHAVPAALVAMGLVAAATIVLRAVVCVAGELARAWHERRKHVAFLAAAGKFDPSLGAVVLDQDSPAVYCLPSGRHRVVVSASALDALAPGQLQAVLAHEQAHLRARHHLILTVIAALARAFPHVPLLALARAEVPVLAEMAADDAATRRHHPDDLAAALVTLARARARATALTAGGTATTARIQRLLAPHPPVRWSASTAKLTAGAMALMLPAAIACLPFLAVACDVSSGH